VVERWPLGGVKERLWVKRDTLGEMTSLQLRGCQVSLSRREVVRGDEVLILSSLETDLLRWFLDHLNKPVKRDELLVQVLSLIHISEPTRPY